VSTIKTFTIAGPAGPVTLKDGSGSAAYTVTNTSSDAVEGTLSLHAQAPASDDWLALPGEATQTYAAGAVVPVAVTITVPTGTAPGTYALRLDAERAANPEEDYTEGPLAAFTVPVPPPIVPWWRRYWWAIAIAVLVVIVIVVIVVAS
jgi:hypothetical protein